MTNVNELVSMAGHRLQQTWFSSWYTRHQGSTSRPRFPKLPSMHWFSNECKHTQRQRADPNQTCGRGSSILISFAFFLLWKSGSAIWYYSSGNNQTAARGNLVGRLPATAGSSTSHPLPPLPHRRGRDARWLCSRTGLPLNTLYLQTLLLLLFFSSFWKHCLHPKVHWANEALWGPSLSTKAVIKALSPELYAWS